LDNLIGAVVLTLGKGQLNKASRFVIAYDLLSAKKPETRQRRFAKYLTMLANEEKPK
tara:strand:+ start:540 stop:710 length:171 start_codon:yes stop_codon:yes gene_type:complete